MAGLGTSGCNRPRPGEQEALVRAELFDNCEGKWTKPLEQAGALP